MLRNRSVRPVGECDHQALVQTSGSFVDSVAIDTDEFEFNLEHVDSYPTRGGRLSTRRLAITRPEFGCHLDFGLLLKTTRK